MIYNVVPWSYLSPQLLCRILREVPGVIGVKQSAGDLKLLADLLLAAPAGSRIFSAVDALLYPSFALGAHGSSRRSWPPAPRVRRAVGRGGPGRSCPGARPAPAAAAAVERHGRRQPAGLHQIRPDPSGLSRRPAARADARRVTRPAAGDPGGFGRRDCEWVAAE